MEEERRAAEEQRRVAEGKAKGSKERERRRKSGAWPAGPRDPREKGTALEDTEAARGERVAEDTEVTNREDGSARRQMRRGSSEAARVLETPRQAERVPCGFQKPTGIRRHECGLIPCARKSFFARHSSRVH